MITIDTAATLHSLIDPIELELSLSLDQFPARMLAIRATKAVEHYCGRVLVSESVTERKAGEGVDVLRLERYPVTELTSFTDLNGSITFIEDTDYILDADKGWLHCLTGVWSPSLVEMGEFATVPVQSSRPNFKIIYTAGFTVDTCPEDLKSVVEEIAELINSGAAVRPYASEGIGDWSYSRGNLGMFTGVADRLNKYRRRA